MNEYVKQAKDFLESCNATMTITYLGKAVNKNWNEVALRNTYRVTITTPKGSMWVKFWDSINNTNTGKQPTEYDILACLQKYEVGDFEDFVSEYGYEVDDFHDKQRAKNIYYAVCVEYAKVKRCFTEEQIEEMCEIQ
jgi:hypothetical protein